MSSYVAYHGPDPAAAYAKQRLHALVANGVLPRYLPEWDRDPAAAWRGVSSMVAQTGYFNHPHRAAGTGSADALLAQMGMSPATAAAAAPPVAPAVAPELGPDIGFQGQFLPPGQTTLPAAQPDRTPLVTMPGIAAHPAGPRAALIRHALMGMLTNHPAASRWQLAPHRPVPRAAANWALAP